MIDAETILFVTFCTENLAMYRSEMYRSEQMHLCDISPKTNFCEWVVGFQQVKHQDHAHRFAI